MSEVPLFSGTSLRTLSTHYVDILFHSLNAPRIISSYLLSSSFSLFLLHGSEVKRMFLLQSDIKRRLRELLHQQVHSHNIHSYPTVPGNYCRKYSSFIRLAFTGIVAVKYSAATMCPLSPAPRTKEKYPPGCSPTISATLLGCGSYISSSTNSPLLNFKMHGA